MDLFSSRTRFTLRQGYGITVDAVSSASAARRARRELGMPFFERLMLAVTEVNGCALCSYGHARASLEAGLSNAEIRALLGGDTSAVPEDEASAVAFAQHYAESRGHPSRAASERLVEVYGERGAGEVLAAVRMIMWGNAYGIPLTSLVSRIRRRPHADSTLAYELSMLTSAVAFVPAAAVAATARRRHPRAGT